MCTVTYLPTPEGFILSSNRDESPLRSATPIVEEIIGLRKVSFPRDPKGGSWIFTDDLGRVLIVLNGAFVKHKHQPPYRMSRGLIAKDFFKSEDTITFIRSVELQGIEPFTMILFDGHKLLEFRWDEDIKHVATKNISVPHIWSSSTLYSAGIQAKRESWFYHKLWNTHNYNLSLAMDIHRSGDIGDTRQNYVMNRDDVVRTVSISHVEVKDEAPTIHFESLV